MTRPRDKKVSSLVVSQVIGDLPTEVLVFASLVSGLPVMVVTGAPDPRLWPVAGDRIRPPLDLKKR